MKKAKGRAKVDPPAGEGPGRTGALDTLLLEDRRYPPPAWWRRNAVVRGRQPTLTSCASQVIDGDRYQEIDARQDCAAVYCGPAGQCMLTGAGAGCACNAGFVAQRFKLSGGSIKNVAVAAAFLAAREPDGEVRTEHLLKAARREFQKMGKTLSPVEFGDYAAAVLSANEGRLPN